MTPKTEPQVFTIEQREQWPSNVFMLEGEEHEEYYIQSFEELLERLEFWDIKNPGPIYFCKPVYLSELDLDEILEPRKFPRWSWPKLSTAHGKRTAL